jgi:hypothetical protein
MSHWADRKNTIRKTDHFEIPLNSRHISIINACVIFTLYSAGLSPIPFSSSDDSGEETINSEFWHGDSGSSSQWPRLMESFACGH